MIVTVEDGLDIAWYIETTSVFNVIPIKDDARIFFPVQSVVMV